jgi:hypothetical protein
MFNKIIVNEALKQSQEPDPNPKGNTRKRADYQDSLISLLIYDIFGGEILKTHMNKRWHFYNRIDGKRIDFTMPKFVKYSKVNKFEDIPATPDETYNYFEQVDYSTFLMKFVRAFEEAVGLDNYKAGYSS